MPSSKLIWTLPARKPHFSRIGRTRLQSYIRPVGRRVRQHLGHDGFPRVSCCWSFKRPRLRAKIRMQSCETPVRPVCLHHRAVYLRNLDKNVSATHSSAKRSLAARALATGGGEPGRETARCGKLSDRKRSPRLSSAHRIRAFLLAIATAATFGPRSALIRVAQRLYESVFDTLHLSEARAPWISKVRKWRSPLGNAE
jgi:hypothetical protein